MLTMGHARSATFGTRLAPRVGWSNFAGQAGQFLRSRSAYIRGTAQVSMRELEWWPNNWGQIKVCDARYNNPESLRALSNFTLPEIDK